MERGKVELTYDEINMLDKLTQKNKMDCWFWIDDDGNVRDLENDYAILDTADAVLTVNDGTYNAEKFLNKKEMEEYNGLIARCKQAME